MYISPAFLKLLPLKNHWSPVKDLSQDFPEWTISLSFKQPLDLPCPPSSHPCWFTVGVSGGTIAELGSLILTTEASPGVALG